VSFWLINSASNYLKGTSKSPLPADPRARQDPSALAYIESRLSGTE
jgi:hypothetical protein